MTRMAIERCDAGGARGSSNFAHDEAVFTPTLCYFKKMKIAQGRVVRGSVVTRSKFPEGARVTLVEHDDRTPVGLDPDEEAAILKGIEEIEAGRGIPVMRLRSKLRRHRS